MTKILIFEFITGGGLAQEDLPESLAREGRLMLEALLNDLAQLSSIQMTVLLDWRCKDWLLPNNIRKVIVSNRQSVYDLLPTLIAESDGVWPIAPEKDKQLEKVSALVEVNNKILLNSTSEAVAICSDKWVTTQLLKKKGIAVVATKQLSEVDEKPAGQWVIKLRDGMGCLGNYLISNEREFIEITAQIESKSAYIIQPFVTGDSLSLSCLFKQGKAWLLCCNRQAVSVRQKQFKLDGCEVNIATERLASYQNLIDQVAKSIKGLWGYVGIDIIQPEQGSPLILEVNPRLTTSYVGIHQALGFNVAEMVISLNLNKSVESRFLAQATDSTALQKNARLTEWVKLRFF